MLAADPSPAEITFAIGAFIIIVGIAIGGTYAGFRLAGLLAKRLRYGPGRVPRSKSERAKWLTCWEEIHEGLPRDRVRSLLGEPDEIKPLVSSAGDTASTWRYGRWPTKGTVTFCNDLVVGMKRPTA